MSLDTPTTPSALDPFLALAREGLSEKCPKIRLFFDIIPLPKLRARMTKSGRAYTPEKTRTFEEAVRLMGMEMHEGDPLEGPLLARVQFQLPKPPSVPKKRKYPVARPDLSNYIKAVEDALNGVLYVDDSQIIQMIIQKVYDKRPGVLFELYSLD